MALGAAGAIGSAAAGPALAAGGFGLISVFGAFAGGALLLVAVRAGLFTQPAPEAT
jgi:hypothetical protein